MQQHRLLLIKLFVHKPAVNCKSSENPMFLSGGAVLFKREYLLQHGSSVHWFHSAAC